MSILAAFWHEAKNYQETVFNCLAQLLVVIHIRLKEMNNRCLATSLAALLAVSAWCLPALCGGGDVSAQTQSRQERLVKGTVTSQDGEPLVGAFVYVKNSKQGVNTDVDGRYEIAAPAEGQTYTLVFQFLGMTTKEFAVSGPKTLNVRLSDDSSLEEAVIVGAYGVKQKKEDMIGSAFQVNADALKDKPKARIDNILNGLVPGLLVENDSDAAGSTRGRLNVRVRGNASLSASNEPLWIIDGVPTYTGGKNNMMPGMSTTVSPLSLIDPNDIESITVLKDADQTTIYGANGANGVILVTTKRGVAGNMPLKVSATVNYGVSSPDKSTMVKVMNASQYLEVAKEAWVNGGNLMSDFPYQDNDYNSYSTTSTDWFKEYMGLGSTLYASLSLSTGTKKAKTYVSGSYYRNENTVKTDRSQRFYLRMNQDYDLTERLKMGVSLMATYNNDNLFYLTDEYLDNLPIFSPYLEDGKTYRLYNKIWSDTGKEFIMKKFLGNKLPDREYNDNIQNSLKTIGNFKLDWTIIDGLKLSSVFGVEYQHHHGSIYYSRQTLSGMLDGKPVGESRREDATYFNWTNTNKLDYSKKFGLHSVGVYAGLELHHSGYNTAYASGRGFMNDHIKEVNYAEKDTRTGGSSTSISRTMSYFVRGTYSYDSRYYLSANYRRDGNSSFGKYKRWAQFWSVGASWNIHKEAFYDVDWLKVLKLKATYGTSGNSRIDTSVAAGAYSYDDSYSYIGVTGATLFTVPNPGLSWETTRMINFGLDAQIGRVLDIEVEYYKNVTKDLLSRIYVSRTISDDRIYANVGRIRNSGFEINLTSHNIARKDFEWNTTLNFSHNSNKILELYNGIQTGFINSVWKEGYDSNTWYLVRWAGVDPADGMPMWYDKDGNLTKTYSTDNRVAGKSTTPFGFGGLINNLTYGNWSLSFQINYVIGGYSLPTYASTFINDGYNITSGNQAVEVYYYRWTTPGEASKYPIASQKTTSSARFSTRFLYSKTNFNLSNLTLSYRLPKSVISKLKVEGATASLICDNLYLFVPGQSRKYNSYKTLSNGYPVTRTITLGLNVSF